MSAFLGGGCLAKDGQFTGRKRPPRAATRPFRAIIPEKMIAQGLNDKGRTSRPASNKPRFDRSPTPPRTPRRACAVASAARRAPAGRRPRPSGPPTAGGSGTRSRPRASLRLPAPVADKAEGAGEDDVDRRIVDGIDADRAEHHDRREHQPIRHAEQPHPDADQRQLDDDQYQNADPYARG